MLSLVLMLSLTLTPARSLRSLRWEEAGAGVKGGAGFALKTKCETELFAGEAETLRLAPQMLRSLFVEASHRSRVCPALFFPQAHDHEWHRASRIVAF